MSDSTLAPDYGLSAHQLFCDTARNILSASRNLDLPSFPTGSNPELKPSSLPSWVPDFEHIDQRVQQLTYQELGGEHKNVPRFKAAGVITWMPSYSNDGGSLLLEAQWLDEIVALSSFNSPTPAPETIEEKSTLTCKTHYLFLSYENTALLGWQEGYVAGGSLRDAFWKSINASWYPKGEEFHRDLHHRYDREWVLWRWLHRRGISCDAACVFFLHIIVGSEGRRYMSGHTGPSIFDTFLQCVGVTTPQFYSHCRAMGNRRMFRSRKGYIGLAPMAAIVGDSLALVRGSKAPLVLRSLSSAVSTVASDLGKTYKKGITLRLVGDAYVHGVVFGEAISGSGFTQIWLS